MSTSRGAATGQAAATERLNVASTPWQSAAACTPEVSHLFDPLDIHDRYQSSDRLARAAAICSFCTVSAECLEDARANGDSGVRAGLMLHAGTIVPDQPTGCRPLSTGRPPASTAFPTRYAHRPAQEGLCAVEPVPDCDPVTEALVRGELARIYGARVEETAGRSTPRPASETSWERARLNRAARHLAEGA